MALEDYHEFFADLNITGTKYGLGQEDVEGVEEIEYMYFLKLDDFEQLEKARSSERQEQWSMLFKKNDIETILRCRRINSEDEERFVLATKTHFPGVDGKWELEKDAERVHFDLVKENAESGMIKRRYFFPVDGTSLIWEIDVFYDPNGEPVPWVKVDLEVPRRTADLPLFPVTYVDAVVEQPDKHTDTQKRLVKKLFKDHYLIKVPAPK